MTDSPASEDGFGDFEPQLLAFTLERGIPVAMFEVSVLTDDENLEQLEREMNILHDQFEHRFIVLDLSVVQFATSSLLARFIKLHRKLHREGGRLALCNLSEMMQEILLASRLDEYFTVGADREAAVAELLAIKQAEVN